MEIEGFSHVLRVRSNVRRAAGSLTNQADVVRRLSEASEHLAGLYDQLVAARESRYSDAHQSLDRRIGVAVRSLWSVSHEYVETSAELGLLLIGVDRGAPHCAGTGLSRADAMSIETGIRAWARQCETAVDGAVRLVLTQAGRGVRP